MESLVNAVSQVDLRTWLVLIVVILLVLLSGYTIGSRILGFGPHRIKETETFEYRGNNQVEASMDMHEQRHGRVFRFFSKIPLLERLLEKDHAYLPGT